MNETHAILLYFSLLIGMALTFHSRKGDLSDFLVGRRSMNSWLTALSAHASDMSSWLFMAFPATIFTFGLFKAWVAIGLLLFMYLNWQFVAPQIRRATEATQSLTFFSYLQNRFGDKNLTLYASLICLFFYSIYIASGLMGMGLLIEELYGLSYSSALLGSLSVILLCLLLGGYRTLAWIDLFQGCFLLFVLLLAPFCIGAKLGGWSALAPLLSQKSHFLTLFPSLHPSTFFEIAIMVFGWGLGYFGQPAILTKFMGIERVEEMRQAKWIGMIWMGLSLTAATAIGLVALAFYASPPTHPEMIFVEMVQGTFPPFLSGLILCAVFAATINVISSQMLVIGSSVSEDLYDRFFSSRHFSPLLLTKLSMLLIAAIAFAIAHFQITSIYHLVLYAWSGLGSAFGPLLLFSLYSKSTSRTVAWAAVLTGSLSSALWPWLDTTLATGIDPAVIGFALSFAAIGGATLLERPQTRLQQP